MTRRFHSRALLAGASLALMASAAMAQTVPEAGPQPEASQLDEVIVTAQRRGESLQRTSVVVDVVSQEVLTNAGVANVADIGRVSPGISISTPTSSPQIYIRGVGDFAATALNNPAVAINVDGVYVARPESLTSDFFDLERIEVLKGPQGTLYGRNASGGALNLITARPRLGQYSGNLDAEFGNYNAVTVTGAINIPLGEEFAVRVSGNAVQRDGFTTAGFGDADTKALRLRALWEPSEAFSLLLNASAGHVGGKGPAAVLSEDAGLGKFVDAVSPAGRAYIQSRIPNGAMGGPNIRAQVVLPDGSQAGTDMDFVNVSAELTADLGFATLTVIPAYRDASISYQGYPFLRVGVGDGFSIPSASPGPPSTSRLAPKPETSEATSLEIRLSDETDRLKWVLGAYYFNEEQYSQYSINVGPLQQGGVVSDLNTTAYAAFAQATLSLTDRLRAIGGLRYTTDERELANGATYAEPNSVFGFAGPPTFAPIPGPPFAVLVETYAGSRTYENTSWKLGLEYDVAPDSLFFATVSTGFKAGGFNQLAAFGTPGVATAFEPEKLTAYDIGLKNRFLDNRLQLNLGAFYWEYENQQVNRFGVNSVGGVGIEFVNAQEATIKGASTDLIARVWQGGTINASVEYTDAVYDTFRIQSANVPTGSTGCAVSPVLPIRIGPNGPIQSIDCSGFALAKAPEWVGSLGITQTFDLADGATVSLTGDMAYSSSRQLTFDYVDATEADSFAVFNATIGYDDPSGRYSVLAFVRNIGDEQVLTGGNQPNFAPNTLVGSVQLPRTYGIRLGASF